VAIHTRICFCLLVGAGGGVPSGRSNDNGSSSSGDGDIRLGDVVVSAPDGASGGVVHYDSGKVRSQGRFERTGCLNKPPLVLLTAINHLSSEHKFKDSAIPAILAAAAQQHPKLREYFARPAEELDRLYVAEYAHQPGAAPGTCDRCSSDMLVRRPARIAPHVPFVHLSTIASGDVHVQDAGMRDRVSREHRVLCFETEAAGVIDRVPCLVIRSVNTYADSHYGAAWTWYAAATAAAYAKELLGKIAPHTVQSTPLMLEVLGQGTHGSILLQEDKQKRGQRGRSVD
jgi:hypothetical protein